MRKWLCLGILLVLSAGCTAPHSGGSQGYGPRLGTTESALSQPGSVILYTPLCQLNSRLEGVGIDEKARLFSDYVWRLQDAASQVFAAESTGPGVIVDIAVALRPPRRSRVWLMLGENHLDPAIASTLKQRLEAVPALDVRGGFVAFAVNFTPWGGGTPIEADSQTDVILRNEFETSPGGAVTHLLIPIPRDWAEAAPRGTNAPFPDALIAAAWPDQAASSLAAAPAACKQGGAAS